MNKKERVICKFERKYFILLRNLFVGVLILAINYDGQAWPVVNVGMDFRGHV